MAILGTCPVNAEPVWSDEEWEILIAGLVRDKRRDDLWRLVFSALLAEAITGIHALQSSGWTPPPGEEILWEELCSSLPASREYPLPPDEPLMTISADEGKTLRLVFSLNGSLFARARAMDLFTCGRPGPADLSTPSTPAER